MIQAADLATRCAELTSALIAIRDVANGFSQRQSEKRGFTDACLRFNRIAEVAHDVLAKAPLP